MDRIDRLSRVGARVVLIGLLLSIGAPKADAVDVSWTTWSTLLRIHGDTNLDRIEDDERFRVQGRSGALLDRRLENTNGRATGLVAATASATRRSGSDAVSGRVELRTTGQWEEDPFYPFDESRAEYSISFFAPGAMAIDLSGVLRATQTSRVAIFVDAFDDGRYWEPFRVTDDPPFTSRTIRAGDPPDVKTIDQTVFLDPLTTEEGTYRLYFYVYGDAWNELEQEATLDVDFTIRVIPEPGTAMLVGLGLAGLARGRSRRSEGVFPGA